MTRILIFSLAGDGDVGTFETQLGNVAILVPTVELLKKHIPDAVISTNIQFREEFCTAHRITRIPRRKRYRRRFGLILEFAVLLSALAEATIWTCLRKVLHVDAKMLIRDQRLRSFAEADIVLDLNGDIFPSDTSVLRIVRHTLEVMTISRLGNPVVEFVSSPGPFKTWFRRTTAKIMYRNVDLFLNREPVSSALLREIGIRKPVLTTACPAFLLEPAPPERAKEILSAEGVGIQSRPLVGITLSGYNLHQRTWAKRESFEGLELFVPVTKWLLDDLKANVILLPHVYRVNPYVTEYELINGPDHDILLNLFRLVDGESYCGRLRVIEGKYTASEAKSVIGQCDMYVSGRLHAGVAALSQGVPTVLLSYGHKHKGFARLVGQEKYAYNGRDPQELKSLAAQAWAERDAITGVIRQRMQIVRQVVHLNFHVVQQVAELGSRGAINITQPLLDQWAERGS